MSPIRTCAIAAAAALCLPLTVTSASSAPAAAPVSGVVLGVGTVEPVQYYGYDRPYYSYGPVGTAPYYSYGVGAYYAPGYDAYLAPSPYYYYGRRSKLRRSYGHPSERGASYRRPAFNSK